MPQLTSLTNQGSRIAACAAAGCGVHCALSPILIPIMPMLGVSQSVERGALVATFLLGALMLGLGPGRSYASILTVFAIGAFTWAASLAGLFTPLPEPLTSALGSLLMAGALFESVRRCAPAQCERCDAGLPADMADQGSPN